MNAFVDPVLGPLSLLDIVTAALALALVVLMLSPRRLIYARCPGWLINAMRIGVGGFAASVIYQNTLERFYPDSPFTLPIAVFGLTFAVLWCGGMITARIIQGRAA